MKDDKKILSKTLSLLGILILKYLSTYILPLIGILYSFFSSEAPDMFYLYVLFIILLLCNIFLKFYEQHVTDGIMFIDESDPKDISYKLEINEPPDTFSDNSIMTIKIKYRK